MLCTFWLANVLCAAAACNFLTSINALGMLCFVHLDLQMCFVLERRAIFWQRNFQILTWKCPSGHSGVQIFISPLTTWLRTCRFSEPTFRPSRCTNHEKNTAFRDFRSFCAPVVSFFWLYFSAVLFIWLDFFWLYFSFISPYCRKFDS